MHPALPTPMITVPRTGEHLLNLVDRLIEKHLAA